MKVYLISLGAGLLVGIIYSLINVRSRRSWRIGLSENRFALFGPML